MSAIEIDQRAVKFLKARLPNLKLIHEDVLKIDFTKMSLELGGPLNIIGNLPYHITSEIFFHMADHHKSINSLTVTTQLEVAQRYLHWPFVCIVLNVFNSLC